MTAIIRHSSLQTIIQSYVTGGGMPRIKRGNFMIVKSFILLLQISELTSKSVISLHKL